MLLEDMNAPVKQRHTARRVLARLVGEHGADALSYFTVREYVWPRRPELDGRRRADVYVQQENAPGAEAETKCRERILERAVHSRGATIKLT